MATFTIDIPNELITESLAAATNLNQRLPERDRAPQPITFDGNDVRNIVANWLKGLVTSDLRQQAEVDAERAAAQKARDLDDILNPPPPEV